MTPDSHLVQRTTSWGQQTAFSVMDRFGIWLSERQIRKRVAPFRGKRIADIGCGYHAVFVRKILHEVAHATVLDLALSNELKAKANLTAFEGPLPETLERIEDGSMDVLLCNNVLEHLSKPKTALEHMRRMLAPNGVVFLNVPS